MVLGKVPVPGRPTNLDYSRARAYCACSGRGWGCLNIFSLNCHFPLLFPVLWVTARYRLKHCFRGPLRPKQPTNQSTIMLIFFENVNVIGNLLSTHKLCVCVT